MNLFKTHYKLIASEDSLLLVPQSQIKHQPRIEQVVLSAKFDQDFGSAICVFDLLGLQRPKLSQSKKNSLSLHLKKGEVVGIVMVLRKNNIYTFLERFVFEILPSLKKVSNLSIQKNSLHCHISDVFVLEDISNHYISLQGLRSLDVVIQTKNACKQFHQAMRFPFKSKKLNKV
jgi:ribosomal protein L5